MTDVGTLNVKVTADTAQAQQQFNSMGASVKQAANGITDALGAVKGALGLVGVSLGATAIIGFAKNALDAADNLYILGQRTGFAASTLSALNIPLQQNGSNVDEFSSSMKFMSRNVELASEGNTTLITRFNDLGLSVTKLKALSPEQQFYAIAQALGQASDQGNFMADGMAIMGRGFASIAPLIKDTQGNISSLVQAQIEAGNALTDADIKKVHDFEDAWTDLVEHTKVKIAEWLGPLIDAYNIYSKFIDLTNKSNQMTKTGVWPSDPSDQTKTPPKVPNAKGTNADLAGPDKTEQDIDAYIDKLKDENQVLQDNKDQQAGLAAVMQLVQKIREDSIKDGGDEITQQEALAKIGDDRIAQIEKEATANADLKKTQQDVQKAAEQMQQTLSSGLTNIAFNFKSAGQAASQFLTTIAQDVFKKSVADPLSTSLVNLLGGSGGGILGDVASLFGISGAHIAGARATGGPVSGGSPYLVGENGPEIFTPGTSGGITPNNKIGSGGSVMVTQVFNMQPGLAETVGVAIRSAAPQIAAAAHASVIQAFRNGGTESQVVGLRA